MQLSRPCALIGSILFVLGALSFAACSNDGDAGDDSAGGSPTGGNSTGGASSGSGGTSSGSGGTSSVVGSDGCGKSAPVALGEWVEQSLDVAGTSRSYVIRLPANYDSSRAYPVVYQFHGCSDQRDSNNPALETASGNDAILVRGRAVESCWEGGADGPDVAFFDALVPAVEGATCADESRRFVTGYSSGSFLAHTLSCVRADEIRAVATIAGGYAGGGCEGSIAALLVHDRDDGTVDIAGSEGVRDQIAERNHCDVTTDRSDVDPAPCEAYSSCDEGKPVIWCETSGKGHDRQDAFVVPAFWNFFQQF